VRQGFEVFGACALAVGAVVLGVTALVEPLFAASLLGESATPWDLANWTEQLRRLATEAPDLFVVPALGALYWMTERPRRAEPVVLGAVMLGSGLITAGKLGSGLNYFLSLRLVEALAVAALWRAAAEARHPWRAAAVVLLATVSLVPGAVLAASEARGTLDEAAFFRSPAGRRALAVRGRLVRLAEDPKWQLLTDSGLLQLYQRDRAPFVDPFQFRHMAESGQIRPTAIRRALEAGAFDAVITTTDLNGPGYDASIAGLPPVLARAARARYALQGRPMGWYLYGRRAPAPHTSQSLPSGITGPPERTDRR
jgi:hypothetical protein